MLLKKSKLSPKPDQNHELFNKKAFAYIISHICMENLATPQKHA